MSDENELLHVDIVEYPEEHTFVAECLEVPIIVEADTFDKVTKKINLAIKGYFDTFPDKRHNFRQMLMPLKKPVQESGGRNLLVIPFPLVN